MDSLGCAQEITSVADVSDSKLVSWAYWEYKPFHDITTSAGNRSEGFFNFDGSYQVQKIKALNRAYIQAAQGTILSVNFTSQDGVDKKAGHF